MSTDTITLDDATASLTGEGAVDLGDVAEEVGGAWPAGWYKAEVIEGYTTRNNKTFLTEDAPSRNGESRNARVCFRITRLVKGETEERTMQETFNYRPADFTADRIAYVKEIRQEFKNVKGAWPDKDGQRSSLALAKLGQFQKALALTSLPLTANGTINPASFVGKKLEVQLGIDENLYNEIRKFRPNA